MFGSRSSTHGAQTRTLYVEVHTRPSGEHTSQRVVHPTITQDVTYYYQHPRREATSEISRGRKRNISGKKDAFSTMLLEVCCFLI